MGLTQQKPECASQTLPLWVTPAPSQPELGDRAPVWLPSPQPTGTTPSYPQAAPPGAGGELSWAMKDCQPPRPSGQEKGELCLWLLF